MTLTKESANSLCCSVVEQLAEWPLLPAVLQSGGIESRASSRILLAIESWLIAYEGRSDLLVLPEYRLSMSPQTDETTDSGFRRAVDQVLYGRIDYAIVEKESVGQKRLMVNTVLEVKTNYLCQSDLMGRPVSACDQAAKYGKACEAPAYVLYIVASPIGKQPSQPRDAGWAYYCEERPPIAPLGFGSSRGVQVLGQYPTGEKGRQIDNVGKGSELWAFVLTKS